MIRIFLPPEELTSEEVLITGNNARHLSLVLRVQPGDVITAFDGRGYKYEGIVIDTHKREIRVKVTGRTLYSVESPLEITLAQGIPKGEKMDLIIQKSTELGVHRIIPVITERTQVRHTHKVERWRKISLSASQQSGRDRVPAIQDPVDLEEFLSRPMTLAAKGSIEDIAGARSENSARVILSEGRDDRNLKQTLTGLHGIKELTILVGPEGGFSPGEIEAAGDRGFIEVSLGPRILRTETAPITAISIIQYELGDMG
jgi:16S rRNA (uracil1498-N3)-methyltransferase